METLKTNNPLRSIFKSWNKTQEKTETKKNPLPLHVELEETFPTGNHVYNISAGPNGGKEVMVAGSDPVTTYGSVFIGKAGGPWKTVQLPDETAFINSFLRLEDNTYVASGMSAIGRGTILLGNVQGTEWKSANIDLHPYCTVSFIARTPDGSLIASTGQMVTQGKTKPVLFRSVDNGVNWTKEEHKLPVTLFQSYEFGPDGTLYLGTCGDHTPVMYKSPDGGRTLEPIPEFPGYKTYKMLNVKWLNIKGEDRLLVLVWGYKTEIADRVVRLYLSKADALGQISGWEELPPVEESHFVFSFLITRDQTFFAGSEKGKVFRSDNFGQTWEWVTQFPTNIGAYALYENQEGQIWLGKDFVAPTEYSLWRLK